MADDAVVSLLVLTMKKNNYIRCELLAHTTDAEAAASKILTKLNIPHILQHRIYTGRKVYYADIYIPKYKLILEIDGGYHYTQEQKRKDTNRSAGIRRLGYHIFRLSNKEARNAKVVLRKICALAKKKDKPK